MQHRLDWKVKGDCEHLPNTFPEKNETASDYQTNIAGKIRSRLDPFNHRMRVTGKFCLLISKDRELIFGDGFYNDFPTSGDASVALKASYR